MGKKNSTKPPLTEAQKAQAKVDNFIRVLPPRMDKATKAIRMVGDCTNPTYSYTEEQAKFIVKELQEAVDTVKARFAGEPGKGSGFALPK